MRKPLFERIVHTILWRLFISVTYITGLTLLIPFIFLFAFPTDMEIASAATSPALIWTAGAMIIIAFIVTVAHTHSLGNSLKALGRVTFIPGLIGLVFSIFGRDIVLIYLAATIPGFQRLQGLLTLYVDEAVPKVRYLTLAFFVLGSVLWLLGDRILQDEEISKARHLHR